MKIPFRNIYIYSMLLIAPLFMMCSGTEPDPEGDGGSQTGDVTKKFIEIDDLITNPGQGWLGSGRFPSTVQYLRMQWDVLEPARGVYDWSLIDNAIARLDKKKGASIGIRIMTCSSHSPGKYATPKWVFDEGAKGTDYYAGGNGPAGGEYIWRIEPIYDDPVFMKRHAEFLKALGERYRDNPDISVIDIGSYGNWGEWHTVSNQSSPVPSADVLKKYVDMYVEAFPTKRMVFMTDADNILPYALAASPNIGLRRDGIGSPKLEQEWAGSDRYAHVPDMGEVWKRAPVIFEWWGDYNYLMNMGWSFENAIEFMLKNHVSLINDNIGTVPQDKMYLIDKVSKLAGARIILRELTHARTVKQGESLEFKFKLSNIGVAKIYDDYLLRFYLYDARGAIVHQFDGINDPNDWITGDYELKETLTLPATLPKGTYKLGFALSHKQGQLPMFRLAISLIPKDDSYLVSEFKID